MLSFNPPSEPISYQYQEVPAPSQIFSTNSLNSIEELLENIDKDTLVLWDVDQTLITPEDPILKPKWEKLLDEMLGGKCIVEEGKTRYIFREILMNARHSLVDQKSIDLIQKLQEQGIPTVAFSAAPGGKIGEIESFVDWRIDELKRFGFHFSSSLPAAELPKDPNKEFPPIFKSGVLITSLHDKGSVLTNFLKTLDWSPKKIVFIDDQMSNVESVVRALKNQTQVIGIHYTAANELSCELDEDIAKYQVDLFRKTGRWLSAPETENATLP